MSSEFYLVIAADEIQSLGYPPQFQAVRLSGKHGAIHICGAASSRGPQEQSGLTVFAKKLCQNKGIQAFIRWATNAACSDQEPNIKPFPATLVGQ